MDRPVAIYSRISLDRQDSAGVERQEADAEALAAREGWEVARVYRDNDLSAFQRRVRRPAFEELVAATAGGAYSRVIVWKSDRLVRQPRDLERFLDAADAGTASLESVTEPEFRGAAGLLMLRMLVAFANHESAVKSERVARARKDRAERGKPANGGLRPYGYDATGTELVEAEAEVLRDAAARVLAGESLYGITADLNRRGIPTVGGARWRHSGLRRILKSTRYAGLKAYRGELIGGTGDWPALWDGATRDRLCAVLSRPAPPQPREYLLAGKARCGACGAVLWGCHRPGGQHRYACPPKRDGGCSGVSIGAHLIEPYVRAEIVRRLADPSSVAAITLAAGGDLAPEIAEAEETLCRLARDHYAERAIGRGEFLAAKAAVEARLEELRSKVSGTHKTRLDSIPRDPGKLAERWDAETPAWRQSVVEACLAGVVVHRVKGRGPTFDPSRVELRWRW